MNFNFPHYFSHDCPTTENFRLRWTIYWMVYLKKLNQIKNVIIGEIFNHENFVKIAVSPFLLTVKLPKNAGKK